jgi:L-threonylcarbamoyladenylate synthase
MRVRVVDPTNIDSGVIAEAAAIIRAGGLVAFPTETVYGLGADATNGTAVEGIFAAKGRPSYNPLIVHVPDIESARAVVEEWPDTATILTTRFWPGPLTIVLRKSKAIPDIVTAGLSTVGVRVPSHPVAQALLRAAGRPIAAPSANPSMRLSPTDGRHVAAGLNAASGLLLDAGPVTVGIESTVLDLSSESGAPTILRPGVITRGEIASLIGVVREASHATDTEARRSPGMMDKHYAPRARLLLAASAEFAAIADLTAAEIRAGRRVATLVRDDFSTPSARIVRMSNDPREYARALYATLHQLDEAGIQTIIVQPVPTDDAWDGVRDRLRRANASSD